jgi:hypothetical protein
MGVRRIVTGTDSEGKSVFVRDDEVEPVRPPLLGGEDVWEFGGEDRWPSLPMTGAEVEEAHGFFPPAAGYRFAMFTIPPTSFEPEPIADEAQAIAETERQLPNVTKALTDKEGLHATDSVDFIYILEGEVELQLGAGETKQLKAGDTVIQSGTYHAWVNRHPTEWTKLLVIFVAAPRS